MLKRSVHRWLNRAKDAEAKGCTREAERIVEQILSIYPAHVGARVVRARCWARRGCLECAIKEFDQLLDSDTEQLEARLSLAASLILVGDYEKGVDQLALAARQCVQDGEQDEQAVTSNQMQNLWLSYIRPEPTSTRRVRE